MSENAQNASQQEILDFLRNPQNLPIIKAAIGDEKSGPSEMPELGINLDEIEDLDALKAALKDYTKQVNNFVKSQSLQVDKKVSEAEQRNQAKTLQERANQLATKSELFKEVLDGKRDDLRKDVDAFLHQGIPLEQAYEKALRANGEKDPSFGGASEKPDDKPKTVTPPTTTTNDSTEDEDLRPNTKSIHDTAKDTLDKLVEEHGDEFVHMGTEG